MRALIFAVAFAVLPGVAYAQSDAAKDADRLKQLLQQKFGAPSKTRSLGRQPEQQPIEYFDVKPDGSVRPSPPPQAPVGGPSQKSSSNGRVAAALGAATVFGGHRDVGPDHRDVVQAQAASPSIGVARDTFVIQLKPDITSAQLDALLSKYGLTVERHVPALGLLHVRRPAAPATRGAAPAASSLADVLEPPIVRAIRDEPGVEAAFVDTTIAPKTLPRRVETTAAGRGGPVAWHWRTGEANDGNWGHKMLRMPPVWRVLARARQMHPERKPTRMTFLDVGFGTHSHLVYSAVKDGMPPNPFQSSCQFSHGTHVAGIAGALFGRGRGIDGLVPNAVVEAIPISADSWIDGNALGVTNAFDQRALLYSGALEDLAEFLEEGAPLGDEERRVVNVSLAYNWSAAGFEWGKDAARDQSLKTHVLNSAMVVRFLANRWRDKVLFVTAAGNDSQGLVDALSAELATPFAFAGTYRSATFKPASNILVVEAIDREGRRASFSNTGGHVSAPGVDVMSTLAGVSDEYGVCSGTSQAAPHVTALAAILLELSPGTSPVAIGDIIRSSAVAGSTGGAAPRVDAINAVMNLDGANMRLLADIDGDGRVNEDDLQLVKAQMAVLEAARSGGRIEADLNGDGDIDDDERCWPVVDLNGSGRGSLDVTDLVQLAGQPRGDLDAVQLGWTDTAKDFKTAYADVAFDELVERWKNIGVAVADAKATAPGGTTLPMGTASATPLTTATETASIAGGAVPARRRAPCQ
jgi:subtilisin family serine protease